MVILTVIGKYSVEERLSSLYYVFATATGNSIYLCKLFANKVRANQEGVPWTNPLLATPNRFSVDKRDAEKNVKPIDR